MNYLDLIELEMASVEQSMRKVRYYMDCLKGKDSIATNGHLIPTEQTPHTPDTSVVVVPDDAPDIPSIALAVEAFLGRTRKPILGGDIIKAIRKKYPGVQPIRVANALSRLSRTGRIKKRRDKKWTLTYMDDATREKFRDATLRIVSEGPVCIEEITEGLKNVYGFDIEDKRTIVSFLNGMSNGYTPKVERIRDNSGKVYYSTR